MQARPEFSRPYGMALPRPPYPAVTFLLTHKPVSTIIFPEKASSYHLSSHREALERVAYESFDLLPMRQVRRGYKKIISIESDFYMSDSFWYDSPSKLIMIRLS
jgi:hypothetical protein